MGPSLKATLDNLIRRDPPWVKVFMGDVLREGGRKEKENWSIFAIAACTLTEFVMKWGKREREHVCNAASKGRTKNSTLMRYMPYTA